MRNIEVSEHKDTLEINLLQQINNLREALVSTAVEKGIGHRSVLLISEQLDELIVQYQRIK